MLLGNISVASFLSRIVILIISLSFHEFAHAWMAYRFGDDTAKREGRLTLNPAHHLDLMGSLMFLFSGFGWARPVPVNAYAVLRRSSAGLMFVSLAGPLSNFLLAIIAAIPLRMGILPNMQGGGLFPTPLQFVSEFLIINLGLMLFNLIPIAPLDGESIAEYFFPPSWVKVLDAIRPYGPIVLLVILFVLPTLGFDLLSWVISPVISRLYFLLIGV